MSRDRGKAADHLAAGELETTTEHSASGPPSVAVSERFVPGQVLVGRYRIVTLLGRGGMGEVYRADDLKLGQPVALKFLPSDLEHEPGRLGMLLDEVRIARGVGHANVCRVYDIGEADGRPFLSMEYVDGEDLETLLRRIGRLPSDKAAQVARQLCAGLAAAHAEGVLHRDLKPANIMIDGHGRAKITDFGLARQAEEVTGAQTRAGTPAYMAPEQLAGDRVTVRTDIYALGLVLYELFTGRRPFAAVGVQAARDERSSRPTSPAEHIPDLDPAAEVAILRCLEPDPSARPASALEVAAALPGGDPVAAALAAGETPSPEMVADSPTIGTLRPAVALAGVVATVVLLGLGTLGGHWLVPQGKPVVVLADEAAQALEKLGHRQPFADRDWGYLRDGAVSELMVREPTRVPTLLRDDTLPLYPFWYRASPATLLPVGNRVAPDDPPRIPGSALVRLGPDGDLIGLDVIPSRAPPSAAADVDWRTALELTALDPDALEPAEPIWVPPHFVTARGAWTTRRPDGLELRIEAGAVGAVVSWLRIEGPARDSAQAAVDRPPVFFGLLYLLFAGILAGGLALARANLRSGRGDRRGARRLAVAAAVLWFGGWVVSASHGFAVGEIPRLFMAAAESALVGAILGLFYIAIEPELRRRWPTRLVAWTRALDGRWNDPLVGRDLLVGAIAAAGIDFGMAAMAAALRRLTSGPLSPQPGFVEHWQPAAWGASGVLSAWIGAPAVGIAFSLGFTVLLLGFTIVVRREWAAALVFAGVQALGLAVRDQTLAWVPVYFLFGLFGAILIFRGGLLASVSAFTWLHLPVLYPIPPDTDVWYFPQALAVLSLAVVAALYGAWVSTRAARGAAGRAAEPAR